jgi:hypothetical protein
VLDEVLAVGGHGPPLMLARSAPGRGLRQSTPPPSASKRMQRLSSMEMGGSNSPRPRSTVGDGRQCLPDSPTPNFATSTTAHGLPMMHHPPLHCAPPPPVGQPDPRDWRNLCKRLAINYKNACLTKYKSKFMQVNHRVRISGCMIK